MSESAPIGLRARKKLVTRAALSQEALRLFAERGFEATTVQDIAAAADVSERTFFRYFTSKHDIVLADFISALPQLLDALRARPAEEAPLQAVLASLGTLASARGVRPVTLLGSARATAASGHATRMLEIIADWEEQLARALVEREGVDPDTAPQSLRLRADVTARAALAAVRAALEAHRRTSGERNDDPQRLAALVAEAFAVLASGCSPGR